MKTREFYVPGRLFFVRRRFDSKRLELVFVIGILSDGRIQSLDVIIDEDYGIWHRFDACARDSFDYYLETSKVLLQI